MPEDLEPMDPKSLLKGSAVAAVLAVVVLFVAILPAEYGIDPTGIGKAVGFTRLSDAPPGPEAVTGPDEAVRYGLQADWRLHEVPFAKREGHAGPGDRERIVLPLNLTNVTVVRALLEWTDDETVDGRSTDPDRFDLRIVAPDRRDSGFVVGSNTPGGAGNVSAQVAWQSAPIPEREDGSIVFPLLPPDTSAVGDWSFHVRLLEAGGTSAEAGDDAGNDWRLTVFAERYELDVRQSNGTAGDRVALTLPPGGAVEYKFRMAEGARFTYEWSSTAPVYWDLHAEATGAAADDTTSFATGTTDGERGEHEAPFAGRHGWFWHNRGTQPVTITLATDGDYEILGVT